MTSFPYLWYPNECKSAEISSTFYPQKGVASPSEPFNAATLLSKHSIKWPIVILEGIACGFTIISGTIPSLVKGKSSYL